MHRSAGAEAALLGKVGRVLVQVDDDVVALAPAKQIFAGIGAGAGSANDPDELIEIVEGDLVAFEDVLALAGLAQQEDGAALNHVDAVIDEVADGLVQTKFLGLAVDHGQKDHGEAFLHLRVLVELVENDLGLPRCA